MKNRRWSDPKRRFISQKLHLEAIDFPVSLDEVEFTLFGTATAIAMLHSVDTSEAL